MKPRVYSHTERLGMIQNQDRVRRKIECRKHGPPLASAKLCDIGSRDTEFAVILNAARSPLAPVGKNF